MSQVKTPNDWTREYHDFLAVFDAVNAELSRLPGVIRVSVGVKEQGGALTERMAFRVYVRVKVIEDAIPPEQLVPRTVRGFPTDVVVEGDKVEAIGFNDENDEKSYETKVGGIPIGNDTGPDLGTLGCFATRTSDSKLVLLSCYHVLLQNYSKTLSAADILDKKIKIGQPEYSGCFCCGCNRIGVVVNGVYGPGALLDCAIAEVDEGVPHHNRIRRILRNDGSVEQDGLFFGTDDYVPGRKVWKVGQRTGLTRGTIVDSPPLLQELDVPSDILIAPDPPFPVFAKQGDSGAVVVDEASTKVVGLFKALQRVKNSNPPILTGRALATPIDMVLTAMGIELNASDPAWRTEVGPRAPDLTMPSDSPFHPVADRLRASRIGAEALELVETHRRELLTLVNQSRRGKVAWQRLQGPSFVAAYARSAKEPHYRIPKIINGISRKRALTETHAMLRRLGSDQLRRDLGRYDTALVDLLLRHDSVDAVLDAVEVDSPVGRS